MEQKEINPYFLKFIACPICRQRVKLHGSGQALLCHRCRVAYPIKKGIPVMLEDEAKGFEELGLEEGECK